MDFPHLDFSLTKECIKDITLLKGVFAAVRPNWELDNVHVEDLSMVGFVNVNFICRHGDDRGDALFVRINNAATRRVYDDQLVLGRKFVSKHGLSSKLICTFENGFIEECLKGEGVTWATKDRIKDEKVLRGIVKEMVRYHSEEMLKDAVRVGIQTGNPIFLPAWMDYMFEDIEKAGLVDKSVLDSLPGKEYILKERRELRSVLEGLGARKAFCHDDINAANVYLLEDGKILFTDYETTCLSFVAAEVGYFLLFLNYEMFVNPLTNYPDAEFRRRFCRQYLEAEYQHRGENRAVTDKALDEFERHVAVGKLMAVQCFISYMYCFLSPAIFNTPVPAEQTVPAIEGVWQQYHAEKEELLASLHA